MWPSVQIKDKTLTVPIIQGGMGVGISLGNLAGHVAACGGMGVLSSAHAGYRADDFWSDPQTADVGGKSEGDSRRSRYGRRQCDGSGQRLC